MIPQRELHKALKVAAAFAGANKPGFHVVHFNFNSPQAFEIVATDGNGLIIITLEIPDACPVGARISVPLSMIEGILKDFPADADTEVTVALWDNRLLLTNGVKTFTSPLDCPNPGDFPPYQNIVDRAEPSAEPVYFNPLLFQNALKACAPLCRSKSSTANPRGPVMEIIPTGPKQPVFMRFEVNPDLAAITGLRLYIMGLDAEQAAF